MTYDAPGGGESVQNVSTPKDKRLRSDGEKFGDEKRQMRISSTAKYTPTENRGVCATSNCRPNNAVICLTSNFMDGNTCIDTVEV